MSVFVESELFIKNCVGNDINFLCAERFCAVKRFINNSFCQTLAAMMGDGADRLDIGIIRLWMNPHTAIGGILAVSINRRDAHRRLKVSANLRNDLLRLFKCQSICSVVEALPQQPLKFIRFF